MSKYKYSDVEKQINSVLKYQDEMLNRMKRPDMKTAEDRIFESEELLKSLGYSLDNVPQIMPDAERKTIVIPTWEKLYAEAEKDVGTEVELESLFTDEEIKANKQAILMLNEEYNAVHRLDKFDVTISVVAGLLGAAIDILLVGIPQKTHDGLKEAV